MSLGKHNFRAALAMLTLIAGLALVSSWTHQAWAQSPGGQIYDPGKDGGGDPTAGDPDNPGGDVPPPGAKSGHKPTATAGTGTHLSVQSGTKIAGDADAVANRVRHPGWSLLLAFKLWARYGIYLVL